MRKAFFEFLASEGIFPASRIDELWGLLRSTPEPIGSIAFSHGLITCGDIDIILDQQRLCHRPFGEIAMEMGMLTRKQVEALLMVQQTRAAVEIAEALALAGICALDEMKTQLGRFFTNQAASAVACER
jgi:chorismate-pyruvate lyase